MGVVASASQLVNAPPTHFDKPEEWRLAHVKALHKHFIDGNYDFGMDRPTFDRFFADGLPPAAETSGLYWSKFDTSGGGLVNVIEVLSGLAVMCQSTMDEKVDLLFALHDFNGAGCLSHDELVVLLYLCAGATVLSSGKGVLPEEFNMESIADEAFIFHDLDLTGSLTKAAFAEWLLDFLGINEESPVVGLREFLKRMRSLKHPKIAGPTAGQQAHPGA